MSDFNIDSLLDATLDDLAEVPEFRAYPPGAHKVVINWKMPTKEKPTTITLQLSAVETVELNNSDDTPLAAGTMATVSFRMDNEYGQSAFRKIVASLAEHYGAGTNRELMEKSEGAECLVLTTLRTAKKTEQNPNPAAFTQIAELKVV